jgi:protein phosphatase PTC7
MTFSSTGGRAAAETASDSDSDSDPEKPREPVGSAPADLQAPPDHPGPWFRAAVYVLPHPEKAYRGGEDAYAVSACKRVLAVADGVGGWEHYGVDPSHYSRRLMNGLAELVAASPNLQKSVDYLTGAWQGAQAIKGSSTALVVSLQKNYLLDVCNVGDSAMMVIPKSGKDVIRTKEQTHGFNYPFQLGTDGDDISTAQQLSFELAPGDLVIVATDGLWDNMYDKEVLDLAKECAGDAGRLAETISQRALNNARGGGRTPFSGGKVDDITVIVAQVQPRQPGRRGRPKAAPKTAGSS